MRRAAEDAAGAEDADGRGLRVSGRILESLPNGLYRIEVQTEGRLEVTAHVAGQAALLRLLPGQAVEVELSPYDRSRGRIVARRSGV